MAGCLVYQDTTERTFSKDTLTQTNTQERIQLKDENQITQQSLEKSSVKDEHVTVANTDVTSFGSAEQGLSLSSDSYGNEIIDSSGENGDASNNKNIVHKKLVGIEKASTTKVASPQLFNINRFTDASKKKNDAKVAKNDQYKSKQATFRFPYLPVKQIAPPLPIITIKCAPPQEGHKSYHSSASTIMSDLTSVYKSRRKQRKAPTRKGKIAKRISSNSSRKSSSSQYSRRLQKGRRRDKKSSDYPTYNRSYEASTMRQKQGRIAPREKSNPLHPNSVFSRLYKHSQKLQVEAKRVLSQDTEKKGRSEASPQGLVDSRLSKQSKKLRNKVNTPAADPKKSSMQMRFPTNPKIMSKENRRKKEPKTEQCAQSSVLNRILSVHSESKKLPSKNVTTQKQTGQRKKAPSNRDETHIRLYNYATKSQIFSLKSLEEGLTDITKKMPTHRAEMKPSPTQLRLYEKSKKLQEEGRLRRHMAGKKNSVR